MFADQTPMNDAQITISYGSTSISDSKPTLSDSKTTVFSKTFPQMFGSGRWSWTSARLNDGSKGGSDLADGSDPSVISAVRTRNGDFMGFIICLLV